MLVTAGELTTFPAFGSYTKVRQCRTLVPERCVVHEEEQEIFVVFCFSSFITRNRRCLITCGGPTLRCPRHLMRGRPGSRPRSRNP